MPKPLFDDEASDDDLGFKQSEYSKKYDTLRRKEELLKLKNKYGEQIKDSSDSSSSDDDDGENNEIFDKNFFKTLSCLKNKDPKIYNKEVRFFDDVQEDKSEKEKKYKPMKIRDYNRELVLNEFKDEEDEVERPSSPTYVEEQKELKKMFKNVINGEQIEENDEKIGGLFVKKIKSKVEEEEEEKNYREWLKGQINNLEDNTDEKELKPLKDFWTNPMLDEDEAFLRDYVLNQRFKEPETNKIPSYDEIVNETVEDISEDEKIMGKQDEFEHKFNFRFEEPDQEFIKQYPRTLEHSMRKKDDKRTKKRAEIKQRKLEEKQQKKEEIRILKSLKLKEIQEKIEKIKEVTGNDQLGFNTEDLEGDFDPEEHDRRMHELFDEEYYDQNCDSKKPQFPDLDEELEIENWDSYEKYEDYEPPCEDENFNMDCDYDPNSNKDKNVVNNVETIQGKGKRRRKRRGKFAEALEREKPLFDKKLNKNLSEYINEYYKLDCEDIIGDMPCRFKYREVPACDYGLTIEEILLADDKELDKWYPLKKTLKYRPEHLQINEQKLFSKRSNDIQLKMKILPSLFKTQDSVEEIEDVSEKTSELKKKKKKKKKKSKTLETINETDENILQNKKNGGIVMKENSKKNKNESKEENVEYSKKIGDKSNTSIDLNADKKKTRKRKNKSDSFMGIQSEKIDDEELVSKQKKKKLNNEEKSERKNNNYSLLQANTKFDDCKDNEKSKSTFTKKIKNKQKNVNKISNNMIDKTKKNELTNLTDERLKAYGLNPKKYRNFQKFKKY